MALQDTIEQFNNLDINEIDWSRIGVWPLAGRAFVWIVAIAAIVAGAYFSLIKDNYTSLERQVAEEVTLKQTFQRKALEAARLDQYKELMARMEKDFEFLVSQLPEKTQVPGLLDDIDEKGRNSGLEIVSIKLQPESVGDVYVELPIEIVARGTYHNFGTFISSVAGMSRIVTLHDYTVTEVSGSALQMVVLAKTYRYLSFDEGGQ
ncbi:MAG: type IV pilus assembly protein PilO [Pseudohongiellaceae bacterium]|jgi:type IV pilus assembly protein PilO